MSNHYIYFVYNSTFTGTELVYRKRKVYFLTCTNLNQVANRDEDHSCPVSASSETEIWRIFRVRDGEQGNGGNKMSEM